MILIQILMVKLLVFQVQLLQLAEVILFLFQVEVYRKQQQMDCINLLKIKDSRQEMVQPLPMFILMDGSEIIMLMKVSITKQLQLTFIQAMDLDGRLLVAAA